MIRRFFPLVFGLSMLVPSAAPADETATVFAFVPFFVFTDARDRTKVDFLDLGLATLFSYDHEAGSTTIEVLDLPLIDTLKFETREPGHTHLTMLDIPFFTLSLEISHLGLTF